MERNNSKNPQAAADRGKSVVSVRVTAEVGAKGEEVTLKIDDWKEEMTIEALAKAAEESGTRSTASLSIGVNVELSSYEQWGPGTWDRIPYKIASFASITAKCPQTDEDLQVANAIMYDTAWLFANKNLAASISRVGSAIREKLYPALFSGEDRDD